MKRIFTPFSTALFLCVLLFHGILHVHGQQASEQATVSNRPPVVFAGNKQTITLPVNSITLSGTASDIDGTISNYGWKIVSAPYKGIIANRAAATTTVTGLVEGKTYIRLTVTDNKGATAFSDMMVLVLPQPQRPVVRIIPNAGKDTVLYKNQLRPDTIVLNGTATGFSGTAAYKWRQIDAPALITNSTSAGAYLTGNLAAGLYQFELTVAANQTEAKDTVSVRIIDFMQKNVRPCRTGTPRAFTLSKTDATQVYRPYITRDRVLPELMGGDTLYIPGGTYTKGVEIGDVGGGPGCPIIIAPKDEPVIIKNDGYLRLGSRDTAVVCYAKFDGTLLRAKGYAYGWIVDNSDRQRSQVVASGLVGNWVHHLDISGYRVNHSAVGMMVKMSARPMVQGQYDKFLLRGIRIHDNYIFRSNGEGMYIGHTGVTGTVPGNSSGYGPPPRMDSVEIFDNILDSLALDGIQLSNSLSGCAIYNNLVRRYAIDNITNQQIGILAGGNINSVRIHDNIVVNGKGAGFGLMGYGTPELFHNIIDSAKSGKNNQDAIYVQQTVVAPEKVPALSPVIYDNILKNSERSPVYLSNNGVTKNARISDNYFLKNALNAVANPSLSNAGTNTVSAKTFHITVDSIIITPTGLSLSVTQGDSSASFTATKPLVDWLFGRLRKMLKGNRVPVAQAGADQTITLPVNEATLTGIGYDDDNNIASYKWTKIGGPAAGELVSAGTQNTQTRGLEAGTYEFLLEVMDDSGAVALDTVTVIVNSSFAPHTGNESYVTAVNAVSNGLAANRVSTTQYGGGGKTEVALDPSGRNTARSYVVFPNPVSEMLNVQCLTPRKNEANPVKLTISDVGGRIVYSVDDNSKAMLFEKKINVSHLRSGLYFIRLGFKDGESYARSFVKR